MFGILGGVVLTAQAQPPATSSVVVRPTTSSVVSRPQTNTAVQVRPVTTVEVIQPMTTVTVTHPTTPATPENANAALVQPTKAVAATPSAKGTSKNATTSMSGYSPKQAVDFKAAATSATGGLAAKNVENAGSNATADAARQQQELVKGGLDKAVPQASKASGSSISSAIAEDLSKHTKK